MKTNYKILTNPLYMGAYSLDRGDGTYGELPAVIRSISTALVTDPTGRQKQCVIASTEHPKPFILNATNQRVLQQISRSRYAEDWVGCSIVFYVALNVKTPQGSTDALRIKPGRATAPDVSKKKTEMEGLKTYEELEKFFLSLTPAEQSEMHLTKEQMKSRLKPNNP